MNDRHSSLHHSADRPLLRERARLLARAPESASHDVVSIEVLEFRLGAERYAVETSYVREVYPLKNLTPVPCTPRFVHGVVNVRGRILAVLSLERFFDLPENGLTDLHRVILVGGNDLELGLLADVSVGVRSIPLESLQPPVRNLTGIGPEFLEGVTADRLLVVDMGRLLSDPRIIVHEEVRN